MKKRLLLLIISFLLVFSQQSYASHLLGSDMTYECIGLNKYRVTLNLYRDCDGIDVDGSYSISYYSPTCNVSGSFTVSQVGPGVDITPVCPGQPTSCSGNGPYGIEKYVYQGVLTLPSGCLANDWILGWSNCCRNAAITTLSGASSNDMYIQTIINDLSSVAPCNSSPVFNNLPASIVCVNKPVNYNHGAVDPDGDSLVFSLGNCLQAAGTNVTYGGGFSGTTPLATTAGVTINPQTGAISFTPNQLQIGVLCVKVEEYRNGVKIGETVRDMQFNVINCNNDAPVSSGINGTSNTSPLNFVISTCANSPVCFNLNLSDPNNNNVTATWNNGISGGTLTFNNQNTPTPTADFCWTPTSGDIGTNFFTITLKDNACPIVGVSTFTYTVNVTPSPHTMTMSPDASICPGQSTVLTATAAGSTGITWTPALGLNTTTGGTVTATPAATQIYTATAAFSDGCDLTKSVTVNVKSLPQVAINPRNILACTGQNVTLTASSATTPTPTYSWSTGAATSSIVVAPVATTTYTVTATSNSCTASASATVTINQPTGQACNVLYASPTGVSTNTGTRTSPYDLATAIQKGGCQGAVIKMAVGTYTLDNPLNMLGELTLEGGFDPANNWIKTSLAGATTINRTANNVEDIAGASPRIVAIYGNGVQNVNFQDLTITTANAPAASAGQYGISTYGVHFTNCANYMFRRCQILPGNGGVGGVGANNTTTALAGAAGGAGNTTAGSCDGGDCTLGGDWAGINGGNGGAGATGVTGGTGGSGAASQIGVANPGTVGTAGTGRNGGGGGGGSAGGDECYSNSSAGATGGASASGAGGGGGTAGSNGDPGGPGGNGSPGVNGTTGAAGATGPNGTFAGGFFNPGAAGGQGGFGTGGSGGGGGGGGGRQTCTLCDDGPGNGGGGGGGGGQGGEGGFGGLGGGGSFPLFAVTNGAGAQLIDCNFTSGTGGAGGIGGTGGAGGVGGNGGNGGSTCTGEVGAGGNGGKGGNGGQGGLGGSGAVGTTSKVYVMSGTAPTYLNNGTSIAITVSAVNNPASFGLAAQPEIKVDDISCMGNTTGFYSAAANTWNLGTGASPIAPTTQNPTTVYSALGRKDIVYNTNNYRGFYNVLIANTLGPNEATDAPLVSGVYRVCQNTKVGFNVTNPGLGYIYHWTIKDSTTNTNVITFNGTQYDTTSYFFNTPGVYQSIVTFETSCCGISNPDTIVLVVDTVPDIVSMNVADATLCYDAKTTITAVANNATIYAWAPVSSISGPNNTSSVLVQPSVTTTYSLVVTNANGRCVDTASATVVVNTISLTSSTTGVGCLPDGTATVTVAGTAGSFLYQWSNGTTNGPTAIMSNTITNLSEGTYTVTVTNQTTGCADTIDINVTKSASAFSGFVNNTTNVTCFGLNNGTATFLTFNANGAVTPTWVKLPALTPANPTALGPGNYQLTLVDALGCISVNTFTITEPQPQGVDSISMVGIICDTAQRGSITVSGTGGNGGNTFSWSHGPTTPSVTNLPVGTYTVTVTDKNGCSASRTFNLQLQYSLTANVVVTQPKCFGGNDGTIVVTPTNGVQPYTYTWNSSPVQTDSILDGTLTGTYSVFVKDANNCTVTKTDSLVNPVQITVSIAANPNDTICAGNTTTLTASSNYASATYLWNGTTAGATLSNVGANTYTVVATNTNSCTASASVTVVQIPNHTLALTSAAATETQTVCQGTAITNIVYTFGGGATGATVTGLPAGMTATVSGNTVTISGSSNTVAVVNYTITTTGNACTAATDAGSITIIPSQTMSLTSAVATEIQSICIGTAITPITYQIGGGATNATVSGLPNGVAATVIGNIVTISGTPTTSGTFNYTVTTSGNICTAATDAGTITINNPPTIELGGPYKTCCQSVTLDPQSSVSNVTYSWSTGETTPTLTLTGANGSVNQTISVTVSSAQNCSASDAANVDIFCMKLSGGIIASPDTIKVGGSPNQSQLEVATNYTASFTYNWSPSATLSSGTIYNPIATPKNTTEYKVVVHDNDNNCTDSAVITVVVIFDGKMRMPNAFTPNGDNNNDLFFPALSSDEAKKYIQAFRVYNRWGQLIYDNPTQGWDGKFDGKEQPNEVYIYYVKAAFPDINDPTKKIEQVEQGQFTLIR